MQKIRAVKVDDTTVPVTTRVKSLGVTVDSTLSFDQQVNNVCEAAQLPHPRLTSRQCRWMMLKLW